MSRFPDRARTSSLLVIALALVGSVSGCDKLDGRSRNRVGNRMFRETNFVGAVGEYEKALTTVDDPIIHYNLALAYSKVFKAGYDLPVRLDAKGSLACEMIPGTKYAPADVCVKEGDWKFTDCTDLTIPKAGEPLKGNPLTAKLGAALAKRDLAAAAQELAAIEKALTPAQTTKELTTTLEKVHTLIAGVCPSSYECKTTEMCSIDSPALAELAANQFQIWLKTNPKDDDTRKQMTQVWLDANKYAKAIAYWEDRLKDRPNAPEVIGVLAGINLKSGDWRKSIELYTKLAELAKTDSDRVAAYTSIGNVAWSKLASKSLTSGETIEVADRGVGAFGKVIEINPKSYRVFGTMGSIFNFRAMAHGSSIAWNIDRATARDLQLNACVLNDEAKKANCPCKVLQVGCPPPPPAPTTPGTPPAVPPTLEKKPDKASMTTSAPQKDPPT